MKRLDETSNMNDDKLSISDYITIFVDTYLPPDLNHLQGTAGHIVAFVLNIILISERYLSHKRENSSQICLNNLKVKELKCSSAEPLQDCLDEINIECEEYMDEYSIIAYVLLLSSILNVIYLWWWNYRIYHFFSHNQDEPLNIPHANLLYYDKPYEEGQKVWEICVWNPNKFCLNLLCGFSPVQIGILMLMNKDTRIFNIMLAAFLALQMYFYTDKFISLLRDKEIIFREVQHEYDTKFVKPRIFRQKKNIEIQSIPQEEIITESLRPRLDEKRRFEKFDNPWA
ncbi:155_t:CDS:2 [Funneliformis caledonium]|uniref:155_t:CDS:1 n=1 Tax=Funneliformis caledonium TaxID=1117310 RepID=A0A9N8YTG9_9GLOM|nr:155_t:CDS:2 [Funneliformis caledonium]